jgi:hypothetical protein
MKFSFNREESYCLSHTTPFCLCIQLQISFERTFWSVIAFSYQFHSLELEREIYLLYTQRSFFLLFSMKNLSPPFLSSMTSTCMRGIAKLLRFVLIWDLVWGFKMQRFITDFFPLL